MYSDEWGGITTDPAEMQVPVDDHVVHRGDGVFETLKCRHGGIYCLDEHLDRLFASAEAIGLRPSHSRAALGGIIIETVRAGRQRDCLIRVIVSRGPGGFGVSPAECPQAGLYVMAYHLPPSFMEAHPGGARAVTVDVPLKGGGLAAIKTCNYLPNVLMKAAALSAGADYPIAYDERGFLAEGATENVGVVTRDRRLRLPRPGRILQGITMRRVAALAARRPEAVGLAAVEEADIPRADVAAAAEVLIFGTTPDVTSVVELDRRPVGEGRPGPIRAALQRLLEADQMAGSDRVTPACD